MPSVYVTRAKERRADLMHTRGRFRCTFPSRSRRTSERCWDAEQPAEITSQPCRRKEERRKTDFEDFNFSSNLFASQFRIDVPSFDQLDRNLLSPFLGMHSQLDLAELSLSERLEKNVGAKVDFLFRHRMGLVEGWVRASGGEGGGSERGGDGGGRGRVERDGGGVGLGGQDLDGLSRAGGGRELLSAVGGSDGRESDGSALREARKTIGRRAGVGC